MAVENFGEPQTIDEDQGFEAFWAIVEKHIEDGASFEVNIESKTKRDILDKAHGATFGQLSQVGGTGQQSRGNTRLWSNADTFTFNSCRRPYVCDLFQIVNILS